MNCQEMVTEKIMQHFQDKQIIMDQYVIKFNFSMLYYDMVYMIQLMKDSKDEMMIFYAEGLQEILDKETK